jgi:hypothetical protein
MCRRVTERFFHNCGHVERTEISTINPECIEETHIVLYDGGKFALFAFGADSSPSTGFPRPSMFHAGAVKDECRP